MEPLEKLQKYGLREEYATPLHALKHVDFY